MSAERATGNTKTNMARHENAWRISPEMVGPRAGATEMTIEMLPMTAPRPRSGTSISTVVIRSGSMIAVPDACTIRASSSGTKLGDTAASSVPRLNRPIASPNTMRVLRRWSRKPVTGMTTAIVSMKAVDSHWARPAVTCRSVIRRGRATFMIVSLRMTTKVAMSKIRMTARSRAGRASGAAGMGRPPGSVETQASSMTERMLPEGSVNQAMVGP